MADVGDAVQITDLPDPEDFVVREPQPSEENAPTGTIEVGDLPSRVVSRVSETERNRRFIVFSLTLTLCASVLMSVWAVLWGDADAEQAGAVVAPLATLVTAVVTFYFTRGDR